MRAEGNELDPSARDSRPSEAHLLPLLLAMVGVVVVTLFWWACGDRVDIPAWVIAILSGSLVGVLCGSVARKWTWRLRLTLALSATTVALIGEAGQFAHQYQAELAKGSEAGRHAELAAAVADWHRQMEPDEKEDGAVGKEEDKELDTRPPPAISAWQGDPKLELRDKEPATLRQWLFAMRVYLAMLRLHLFALVMSMALAWVGAFQAASLVLPSLPRTKAT